MVIMVDYGVGNLFSLKSSFSAIGEEVLITGEASKIEKADKIILPGVGAFADAAMKLSKAGLDEIIVKKANKGTPLLGICLGMQLLFEKSYEYGEYPGLGLIEGEIRPLSEVISPELKIPHIGWNSLNIIKPESEILKNVNQGDHVYFVHSYYGAKCSKNVIATAEYGAEITAAVQRDNVFGCQFHPEKSGEVGLGILKAFCRL